ncbi:MAG TPA: hypothetical protein VGC42_20350 [Kofleriaceae bacterium]
MNRLVLIASFALAACTATVRTAPAEPVPPPPPPAAPPPAAAPAGQHPAYLHALSDLRLARAFLARPGNIVVKWDEQHAIREIDAAIHEIREASIDDGKNPDDHPPLDRPTWGGRLQRSLELVEKARQDISGEEDSPSSRVHTLRIRSLEHISNADRLIRDGIEDARALHEAPPPAAPPAPLPPPPPPAAAQHPAYLHALSDLRHARALLERPTHGADVRWDENRAISQLDAAIREIKDAAIDDGKPLSDHPAIDTHTSHRDRLNRAIELMDKASRDIEQHEDNAYASGMRGRALGHLTNAIHAVREALEDRRR